MPGSPWRTEARSFPTRVSQMRAGSRCEGGARGGPVGRHADLAGDRGLHQGLGEHPDALTQQVDVVFLEQACQNELISILGSGHRPPH